jgi:glycosyltransferase involved in cell wall biosynthesis
MKVLHLSHSDKAGGAARAAYRLHSGLLRHDVESTMLVRKKDSDDPKVFQKSGKLAKIFDLISPSIDAAPIILRKNKPKSIFSSGWFSANKINDTINLIRPDVIHLHWICGGSFNIKNIAEINKPVVWSLHDMWAFTGGCHYAGDCNNYVYGCQRCPVLGSKHRRDLSYINFHRKMRIYSKISNFTIVGLSRWISDCASKSLLFKNYNIETIPNMLDTNIFFPIEKDLARKILGLPRNKKIVLFGAMNPVSDPRKGYRQLMEALTLLEGEKNLELVVFGSSKPETVPIRQTVHFLGRFVDEISMSIVYSAADIAVVPSLEENLSNTIMESLACATPVVCFNIGGNNDMIKHAQNGYLAQPFDPVDLAAGITFLLDLSNKEKMAIQYITERVQNNESTIKSYLALYRKVSRST